MSSYKDCLVIRMHAIIDDDSLDILEESGKSIFHVWTENKAGETHKIVKIGATGPLTIEVLDTEIIGLINGDNVHESVENGNKYIVHDNDAEEDSGFIINSTTKEEVTIKVTLEDIENIGYVSSYDIPIECIGAGVKTIVLSKLINSTTVYHHDCPLSKWNFNTYENLKVLRVWGCQIGAALDDNNFIKALPNKEILNEALFNGSDISGNIEAMSIFTGLIYIEFLNTIVEGNLEDAVAGWAQARDETQKHFVTIGRNTNTTIKWIGSNVASLSTNPPLKRVCWTKSGSIVTAKLQQQEGSSFVDIPDTTTTINLE